MKPVIQFYQCVRRSPARRRTSLFSLAGVLLLILGFFINSLATPGHGYVVTPAILAATPAMHAVTPAVHATSGLTRPSAGNAFFNSITVTKDNALDDNIQQDIVIVNISPTPAYPPGQDVTFIINNGLGGANQVIKTDASGNAVLLLSSGTAQTIPVQAFYNGVSVGTVNVTFVATSGTPDSTQPDNLLIVDITDQVVGTTPDQIHAHLVDSNENPVKNWPVTFFLQSGGGTAGANAVFPVTATTNALGNATISISDITAGTVIIGGSYFDKFGNIHYFSNNPVTVNFIVNAPSANPPAGTPNGTSFWVSKDSLSADGRSQDKVKAHISDMYGNTVPDSTPVTITITGNGTAAGGAELPGNVKTIIVYTIAGDVEVPIVDTQVGTVEMSATVNGIEITPRLLIHFFAGPAVPSAPGAPTGPTSPGNPTGTTGTLLTVVGDGATADGVAEDSVKAHITDASGYPVPNTIVTFTIITGGSPGATANAKFSNGTTTIIDSTDANGNVDIPITDITMGNVWIVASINNGALIDGSHRVVTFVAGPAVPSAPGAPTDPSTGVTTGSLLTITQDSSAADGAHPDSVNAHITDKFGNAVANQQVIFTITTGGTLASGVAQLQGNVQTDTLFTDANGNIEVAIFSPEAGTVSINAFIYGTSLIDGSAQTVTFVNNPDVTNPETQLIVVVYEALANGLGNTVVKAHVVDQNGTPLPGQDVTFAIDSGSATIVTAQPVKTDQNGEASIVITSTTPGFVLITATVGGQSITFGSPARVKFARLNIYVPPVFTPNGDGVNDVLKPILVGISDFHYFSVYNRWGNLIFTSEDPNMGWDGRFKGVAQPVETYLWIAEGIDLQGKKIVQKGMTTLVR